MNRHTLKDFSDDVALSHGQGCFRQVRDLKHAHVPGATQLSPVPEFSFKAGRVGSVEDHKGLEAFRIPQGIVPGDDAAPVVSDEDDL